MKNYTKIDELKSENSILKTKIKKLEDDLNKLKELFKAANDINLELEKKVELYEKENRYE